MTRPVFFSDLDDTVFQTARKMDLPPDPEGLASEALNGSHSYMSATQSMMMDWLLATTRFIPVTARSTDALARCRLPFADYRICTNGAVILRPDGSADQDWLAQTKTQAENALDAFDALMGYVAAQTAPGRFRCWVVQEFGTGFYFCVKSNDGATALDDIEQDLGTLAGDKMTRHRNDNNLSFTPTGISKRHAVVYLSEHLLREGPVPVFGMGDSLTDLPFMAGCDMLVIPKKSQINRYLLRAESS